MERRDHSGIGTVVAVICLPILALAVTGLLVFDFNVHMGLVALLGGFLWTIIGLAMVVVGVSVEIHYWRRATNSSDSSEGVQEHGAGPTRIP